MKSKGTTLLSFDFSLFVIKKLDTNWPFHEESDNILLVKFKKRSLQQLQVRVKLLMVNCEATQNLFSHNIALKIVAKSFRYLPPFCLWRKKLEKVVSSWLVFRSHWLRMQSELIRNKSFSWHYEWDLSCTTIWTFGITAETGNSD